MVRKRKAKNNKNHPERGGFYGAKKPGLCYNRTNGGALAYNVANQSLGGKWM